MPQPQIPQTKVPLSVADSRSNLVEMPVASDANLSGVSWPAVIGGAFVSAALALILLSLGTGLGFSSVSPWSNIGASSSTIGALAILWLILTQIMASAMGGYLAGRLRTKWTHVHTDEVYFRDTAHGFLAWAVSMVITAAFLATAAVSFAGGTAQRAGGTTTSSGAEGGMLSANAYIVDKLLRGNSTAPAANAANAAEERGIVERTFAHDLKEGSMPAADHAYLAQVASARTGLNQADADKRVSDVFEEAQQAADKARKALAHVSLWLFVALLGGAFCASYAGTIGGKQRDRVMI
jgi:hypothetical protein